MTAPTAEETDAALAALTGTVTEQRPDTELARNMLRLRLVMDAKAANVPWTAIGQALGGISGKAAKAQMKQLARITQRQLMLAKGPHPRGGRPWTHEMGDVREPMFTVEGPGVMPVRD